MFLGVRRNPQMNDLHVHSKKLKHDETARDLGIIVKKQVFFFIL